MNARHSVRDLLQSPSEWRLSASGALEHFNRIRLMDNMDMLPAERVVAQMLQEADALGLEDPMLAVEVHQVDDNPAISMSSCWLVLCGWAPATDEDIERGLEQISAR